MALIAWPRRLSWPGGLSARLLLLTALFVMLAELLVLGPSLAAFEEGWLTDRVRAAELASLAVDAAPAGIVSDQLAGELLTGAGVIQVALQSDGVRRLVLSAPRLIRTPELVDLRRWNPGPWIAAPFRTLAYGSDQFVLRVVAKPRFRSGDFIEILTPTAQLRRDMIAYLLNLAAATAFVFIVAGALVYASLSVFLIRPMRRITESMERFRERPEDPAGRLKQSGRHDEIGRAEAELSRMQDELRAALLSRARLASLGEAVAKINHDLRNILTSAQMAFERLTDSGDPRVVKALPRLERALNRAIRLAQDVLDFGKSEEQPPQPRPVALAPAAEIAAEDAGLTAEGVALQLDMAESLTVFADPEQLHRILVNLFRNAREAVEGDSAKGPGEGWVRTGARANGGLVAVTIADNGPGVPDRARAHLFQPFAGSVRAGGTGLGLAIARDLARANGGDLELAKSDADGAVFELRLPAA
ncbi:MAG TPA: HAMP domain-containing sensor histidine kinase [Caulobacteraceae bacterium]|jgi:signal transduction histidine kinase|nr:HAMP domain-containing sensor histidine kinase [Caulobacteraceae bacterium]